MQLSPAVFEYLNDLTQHNTREWFHANKARWDFTKSHFEELIAELILRIGEFENMAGVEVKNCNYRIARDVRFSKNKDPYKNWLSASFAEGGRKSKKSDYYLHIQDGESFIGGGMYAPTPEQLAAFRQEIDYSPEKLLGILSDPIFKNVYAEPLGTQIKTSPKGYEAGHSNINLLRFTQFYFTKAYTNEEVLATNFAVKVAADCKVLKPYLDYLNQIFEV